MRWNAFRLFPGTEREEKKAEGKRGIEMTKQEFQELVNKGTVLLDGATGSNLMRAGMPRGVCTEQWICENPDRKSVV